MLDFEPKKLFENLRRGDRNALARSITLVESVKKEHQIPAQELLDLCLPFSGKSSRIGITGVPGVGKSTFIEVFGKFLIEKENKKVAVLAVDPSSIKSKGSILGDKTRMSGLSASHDAFIRPSPSSGSLGGTGLATREIIILCEAAGFDLILVETVGVGQSETEVREMVDFFVLLMLPGAGDELQGIKRGIIELADLILINKADGDNLKKAGEAKAAYTSALHLFPPAESGWISKVELCSAAEGKNLDIIWNFFSEFRDLTTVNGFWNKNRGDQLKLWYRHSVEQAIRNNLRDKKTYEKTYTELESKVTGGKISARKAASEFFQRLSVS